MIKERLRQLRSAMGESSIHCYIIPTSDFHNSEYVSDYFMVRKYFSGFTGSAGTLVVTDKEATLFTDGRYFIQAQKELAGSDIILMKMGEPGVPSITDYVKTQLKEGQNVGFDGRVMPAYRGLQFEEIVKEKKGQIIYQYDLATDIWTDRPGLPDSEAYILARKYCGESVADKLERLRNCMKEEKADVHILTTLDDIAWLFNLRADDVRCCPLLLSYAIITEKDAILFAREKSINSVVKDYLLANQVSLKHYDSFYSYIEEKYKGNKDNTILICKNRIDYRLFKLLQECVVYDKTNPTTLMKAVKNETECENIRKAHLMDAIAVTKLMYGLKNHVIEKQMTELSVADDLEKLRRENESFIEPSFPTICAYGANGAIIHYEACREDYAVIKPEGMLMIDSGGHYFEGSTDITRTFIMGPVSKEMKEHFTLVVRAMLRLKNAKFLYGSKGVNLDILARGCLWDKGLDYKHGTGHGVGYLLSVHEGPNSFRYKTIPGEEEWCFEEGMITTDEPGIYIEGSHGIRIENELLCRKGETNEYGQFMYFEDLTYVPIDLDGIDVQCMEEAEREMLNTYHKQVYAKLEPYFEGDMLAWLSDATRAI